MNLENILQTTYAKEKNNLIEKTRRGYFLVNGRLS